MDHIESDIQMALDCYKEDELEDAIDCLEEATSMIYNILASKDKKD